MARKRKMPSVTIEFRDQHGVTSVLTLENVTEYKINAEQTPKPLPSGTPWQEWEPTGRTTVTIEGIKR